MAGNGAADCFDSVVDLLGWQLLLEPLSGADSDSAQSVRARGDFRIGRDQRGDGSRFLPAQASGDGSAQLISSLDFFDMIVCYVTDHHLLSESGSEGAQVELSRRIAWAAAAGVDWIQIREKDLSAGELVEVARKGVAASKRANGGTCVVVNDRIDVALAAGAAGVHLGGGSVPVEAAVEWLRRENAAKDFLVGVSCHEISEAIAAEKAGANYVLFGPVYETPSKKRFGPPQGIEKLRDVCKAVCIPVVAIGGITQGNASECIRAGAAGIAAIRMFQQARDAASFASVVSKLRALSSVNGANS